MQKFTYVHSKLTNNPIESRTTNLSVQIGGTMGPENTRLILLERTSRSFYPTLKYLPDKTRGQIGLLYLLARVADTIADSKSGETQVLLDLLKNYNDVAQGKTSKLPDFSAIAKIQSNESEKDLLNNVDDVVEGLKDFENEDIKLILECLGIIVGGQILDLERFGPAMEGGMISSLKSEIELDDYTYRVAGWYSTKMSLQHLMSLPADKEKHFEKGIRFVGITDDQHSKIYLKTYGLVDVTS